MIGTSFEARTGSPWVFLIYEVGGTSRVLASSLDEGQYQSVRIWYLQMHLNCKAQQVATPQTDVGMMPMGEWAANQGPACDTDSYLP